MDIDFYCQDPEYIKKWLIKHYFIYLNNIVDVLKVHDENTSNKILHKLHKELFKPPFSLKDSKNIDIADLLKFMNSVENYWNSKINLVFMP